MMAMSFFDPIAVIRSACEVLDKQPCDKFMTSNDYWAGYAVCLQTWRCNVQFEHHSILACTSRAACTALASSVACPTPQ